MRAYFGHYFLLEIIFLFPIILPYTISSLVIQVHAAHHIQGYIQKSNLSRVHGQILYLFIRLLRDTVNAFITIFELIDRRPITRCLYRFIYTYIRPRSGCLFIPSSVCLHGFVSRRDLSEFRLKIRSSMRFIINDEFRFRFFEIGYNRRTFVYYIHSYINCARGFPARSYQNYNRRDITVSELFKVSEINFVKTVRNKHGVHHLAALPKYRFLFA